MVRLLTLLVELVNQFVRAWRSNKHNDSVQAIKDDPVTAWNDRMRVSTRDADELPPDGSDSTAREPERGTPDAK